MWKFGISSWAAARPQALALFVDEGWPRAQSLGFANEVLSDRPIWSVSYSAAFGIDGLASASFAGSSLPGHALQPMMLAYMRLMM